MSRRSHRRSSSRAATICSRLAWRSSWSRSEATAERGLVRQRAQDVDVAGVEPFLARPQSDGQLPDRRAVVDQREALHRPVQPPHGGQRATSGPGGDGQRHTRQPQFLGDGAAERGRQPLRVDDLPDLPGQGAEYLVGLGAFAVVEPVHQAHRPSGGPGQARAQGQEQGDQQQGGAAAAGLQPAREQRRADHEHHGESGGEQQAGEHGPGGPVQPPPAVAHHQERHRDRPDRARRREQRVAQPVLVLEPPGVVVLHPGPEQVGAEHAGQVGAAAGRGPAEQPDQQHGGRDADQQVVDRVVEAVQVVGHRAEGVRHGAVGERIRVAEHGLAVQEGHRVREHPERDGADVPPPLAGGEPPGRQPERQDVEQRLADRVAHRAHHGGRADEPGVGDLHPDGRGGSARQHRCQRVDEHHPTEWISRTVGVQQHARVEAVGSA